MSARKKPKRAPVRTASRGSGKAAGLSKAVGGMRRRYSDAERRSILEAAKRDHLTGAQVRDRFGISTLTFYTWRKRSARALPRSNQSPAARGRRTDGVTMRDIVRRAVQTKIATTVPEILKAEIAHALRWSGSRRRR